MADLYTPPAGLEFHLLGSGSQQVLVSRSRTGIDPEVWSRSRHEIDPDQYFSFLFEDMHIDRAEYDLGLGLDLTSSSIILSEQTLKNNTKQPQEISFQISETDNHTSIFEYNTDFPIIAGINGVPISFYIKAGKRESVCIVSTIKQGELQVPFTVHLSSKNNDVKAETSGVWRGATVKITLVRRNI
ncbi:hemolytic lectin LSL-like protein [Gelatoporia subvermispora B]|uniref:Hemolytic lectin LSL-like protein n=1 Tax=Ceriporiopsis subvermispora (strain B) TaxID=914234 RepID=M2RD52_CERS8|nr:hemolytic lectin LSL-like protein [Gelatoporia subvermispora B]